MRVEELFDAADCDDKRLRQDRVRQFPDNDEQRHVVIDDCLKLVRRVSNAAVVSDGDPPPLTYRLQPHFVRAVVREMIAVPFDSYPGRRENVRKPVAEISIGEEDAAHAARSYSTACSTSVVEIS